MDLAAPAHTEIDLLRSVAEANGVATHFWDWYGNLVDVEAASLLKVLHALGLPLDEDSTVHDLQRAIEFTEDQQWSTTLPDCTVVREHCARDVPVHVPHGRRVTVSYELESGEGGQCPQLDRWVPPRQIGDQLVGRATFEIPASLPLGWHRLVATVEGGTVYSAPLIVVPDRIDPPALTQSDQQWGTSAQFYSVRSASSWGIGDTADLQDIVSVSAARGAQFVLINPVHACAPISPLENSPYLPVTRRWVNPLYIHPESLPEYAQLSERDRSRVDALREESWGASRTDLIDRDTSWRAKVQALAILHAQPMRPSRRAQFLRFTNEGGDALADFSLWCALIEASGSSVAGNLERDDQPLIPEMLTDTDQIERARFELADRIDFYSWCQWVALEQLRDTQALATELGMSIGIMADLAVGVHPKGSDVWATPTLFAPGMTVGAPPDMYSQQGQNWSQPPWSPRELARCGYRPLRDMIRTVLSHAGAVRIDHIMGLFRLWWIPEGEPASHGTYVSCDHEAMVGVLLLEAQRAGAVLIGEDLGTVEPWVRGYLNDRGILGTSVLWFEKEDSGWPLHADQYRRDVLATVNTHDLPPTSGYLDGVQTTLRDQLGLLVDPVDVVRAGEEIERERMLVRLREYGLLDSPEPSKEEIVTALHRFITMTPSRLVGVALVDAVGDIRPQNLPGTNTEYPNWCVPLCDGSGREVSTERLASDHHMTELFDVVNEALPK